MTSIMDEDIMSLAIALEDAVPEIARDMLSVKLARAALNHIRMQPKLLMMLIMADGLITPRPHQTH